MKSPRMLHEREAGLRRNATAGADTSRAPGKASGQDGDRGAEAPRYPLLRLLRLESPQTGWGAIAPRYPRWVHPEY